MLGWAGRRVTLAASKLDRKLLVRARTDVQVVALDGVAGTAGATTPSTTPVVTGDQKTLVILTSFTDKPMSCSAADVQTRLFSASGSSVNTSFRESSRNAVGFSGTVVGPFPIPYASTGACEYGAWQTAAEAAARAAGADPALYKRINIVTPGNSTCGWSGLAYMPGTRSWVQSCGSTGIFTHELGHNLALHHAVTPTSEYGDGSDPMGGARNVRNNAANQVMAGWIPTGGLLDVTSGGSFAIAPTGPEAGTQPQVLRLPKADSNEKYYVSHRAAQGLDAGLSTAYLGNVLVHKATGTLPAKTTLLATLTAGQSYADAANAITITNQGVAGGVATVGVAMAGGTTPGCTRATPSVSLNPASRSVAAGSATTFSATVGNRNSSACGSATFNLASALPSGFSGSVSPASVSLGAGASSTVTWTVASPAAAVPASYDVALSASESSVANSSTTHGSYIVVASSGGGSTTADTSGPAVVITNPGLGAVVSGRITIGAQASDASGVSRVDFFDGSGRLLASDTAAPYTANWNLRKAAKGPQTVTVRAVDNAGNAAQASVTVTVQRRRRGARRRQRRARGRRHGADDECAAARSASAVPTDLNRVISSARVRPGTAPPSSCDSSATMRERSITPRSSGCTRSPASASAPAAGVHDDARAGHRRIVDLAHVRPEAAHEIQVRARARARRRAPAARSRWWRSTRCRRRALPARARAPAPRAAPRRPARAPAPVLRSGAPAPHLHPLQAGPQRGMRSRHPRRQPARCPRSAACGHRPARGVARPAPRSPRCGAA